MPGMGLLALLAYLALALNLIYSALKHRQPGWVSGVVFGIGLLSLPFWGWLLVKMMEHGSK
jgi:4-hydroxybenzoate polyprenyltransferase